MKRKLCLTLVMLICIAFAITTVTASSIGMDNFVVRNTYYEGLFADVTCTDWFSNEVGTAYGLGLVTGKSEDTFDPNGNMRISEAITLACRLHSIYWDDHKTFEQGEPWYQVYVDYAIENGMIYSGQFPDYTKFVTRSQFAMIFIKALPAEALPEINHIDMLPDVYGYESYADDVYALYNAGILTGSDSVGTFMPDSTIRRCEVAAIVTRMALPAMRKTFVLPSVSTEIDYSSNTSENDTNPELVTYIGNIDSRKFHYDWCVSVKKMNEENKYYHTGTREDIIAMGYTPCKNCNP